MNEAISYEQEEAIKDTISWNYTLLHFLKSLEREELKQYKRFNDIEWRNIDTKISEKGKGYIVLDDFGISSQMFRDLINGNKKNIGAFKKKFEEDQKYGQLRKFCIDNGVEAEYMYGEKTMADKVKKEMGREQAKYLSYFGNNRKKMVNLIVDYLNSHDDKDPVVIWFRWFKGLDVLVDVPELKRLAKELDELSIEKIIEYKFKNEEAVNKLYHKLVKAAANIAVASNDEETLKEIVNQMKQNRVLKEKGISI